MASAKEFFRLYGKGMGRDSWARVEMESIDFFLAPLPKSQTHVGVQLRNGQTFTIDTKVEDIKSLAAKYPNQNWNHYALWDGANNQPSGHIVVNWDAIEYVGYPPEKGFHDLHMRSGSSVTINQNDKSSDGESFPEPPPI